MDLQSTSTSSSFYSFMGKRSILYKINQKTIDLETHQDLKEENNKIKFNFYSYFSLLFVKIPLILRASVSYRLTNNPLGNLWGFSL